MLLFRNWNYTYIISVSQPKHLLTSRRWLREFAKRLASPRRRQGGLCAARFLSSLAAHLSRDRQIPSGHTHATKHSTNASLKPSSPCRHPPPGPLLPLHENHHPLRSPQGPNSQGKPPRGPEPGCGPQAGRRDGPPEAPAPAARLLRRRLARPRRGPPRRHQPRRRRGLA